MNLDAFARAHLQLLCVDTFLLFAAYFFGCTSKCWRGYIPSSHLTRKPDSKSPSLHLSGSFLAMISRGT